MDSEHWISRLAAAKRFYAAQLGHADRAGMEEVDMDEEVRPEFACPYCYEDHDVVSLCAHLEEEHPSSPMRRLALYALIRLQKICLIISLCNMGTCSRISREVRRSLFQAVKPYLC
ncbi:hypothetical protein EE612_031146 [Oryza sativa]|nr:hypothetical protein EE612_031146 [Oryza sativa]